MPADPVLSGASGDLRHALRELVLALRVPGPLRGVALLLLLYLAATAPFMGGLGQIWNSQAAFSHAWLAAPLALAWMLVRLTPSAEVPVLRECGADAVPRWLGWLAIVVGSSAWLAGSLSGVGVVAYAGAWLLLGGCLVVVLGPLFHRVLVPWLLLATTLPAWSLLMPLLQSLTVVVNNALIAAVGIRSALDGNFVHLAWGTFEIATGCAGLNYLVGGVALSLLAGEVARSTAVRRLLLLALGTGLSLISNWLRVFALIAIGDATEMQHTLIIDGHLLFGWIVFGIFFAPFLWWAVTSRSASVCAVVPMAAEPMQPRASIVPVGVVLAASAALLWVAEDVASRRAVPELTCPSGSTPIEPAYVGWAPEFPGAAASRWCSAGNAFIYRNAFGVQRPGAELVGDGSSLWSPEWRAERLGGTDGYTIVRLQPPGGSDGWIVVWRYVIGDTPATTASGAKWQQVVSAFRSGRAGVDAVAIPCNGDCAAAVVEARAVGDRW